MKTILASLLLWPVLLFAAAIPGSVVVTGPVAPTDTTDTYPSHLALYGKGGWRTVADATARDAIPAARREEGMIVVVQSPALALYRLGSDLTTWTQIYNPTFAEWFSVNGTVDALEATDALARRISTEAIPLTLLQSSPRVSVGFARDSDALDTVSGVVAGTNTARSIPLAWGSSIGSAILVDRPAVTVPLWPGDTTLMSWIRMANPVTNIALGPFGLPVPTIAWTDTVDTNTHHVGLIGITNTPGNPVSGSFLFKPLIATNLTYTIYVQSHTNLAWSLLATAKLTNETVLPPITYSTNGPVTRHHAQFTPLGNGWWHVSICATVTNAGGGIRVGLAAGGFASYVGNTFTPQFLTAGYNYTHTEPANDVPNLPLLRTNMTLILSKAGDVFTYTNAAPLKATSGTLLFWLRNGYRQPANATLLESTPGGGLRVELQRTNLLVALKDLVTNFSFNASVPEMSYFADRQIALTWTTNGMKAFVDGSLVGTSAPPSGSFVFDPSGRVGSAVGGTNWWIGHIGVAYLPRALSETEVLLSPSLVGPPNP